MRTIPLLPLVALAVVGGPWPLLAQETHPEQAAAPTDPGVSRSSSPKTVHLLTRDRLLEGRLRREGASYVIEQEAGRIPLPPGQLVASYHSREEAYQAKRDQINPRDADEQLALARWCLSNGLGEFARPHLEATAALDPESREAKAMIANLDAERARPKPAPAERPLVDAEVHPAAADATVTRANGPQPNEMRRQAFLQARQTYGGLAAPVVFDLAPALAVKKADEFARRIHPVLQNRCAGCHHERSGSTFQLIQVRRPADNTRDVILSNLDATLRLVDPNNPSRSELLLSGVMPHGPSQRPVFAGQNDPSYRLLSQWAAGLKSAPPPARAAASRTVGTDSERFAANRPEAIIAASSAPELPATPQEDPDDPTAFKWTKAPPPVADNLPPIEIEPPILTGPGGFLPGTGDGRVDLPEPAAEFPLSPLVTKGASKPKAPALPDAAPPAEPPKPRKKAKIQTKALEDFFRQGGS